MPTGFETDAHPGGLRVLFVALPESVHTHSWVDLFRDGGVNIRVFALPVGDRGVPPDNWRVRTYVTSSGHVAAKFPTRLDPQTRKSLYPQLRVFELAVRAAKRFGWGRVSRTDLEERWLAKIIRHWQPHIIHTLGVDPAGSFYLKVRNRFALQGYGTWLLTVRGGSDLDPARCDFESASLIRQVASACDRILCDNEQNHAYLSDLGVSGSMFSPLNPVPGSGGVEVESLAQLWRQPPSGRRLILVPKGYEGPWNKSLPILEALRLCWNDIQPCRVHFLFANPETRRWFLTLPDTVRASCVLEDKLPRERVLDLMLQSRVMLAPSLVDGVPNSMYEAMATGAVPIISPLDTIKPVVAHEENVLFARNLYPGEIADALRRAMNDDELVTRLTANNLPLVKRLADRATIRSRVIEYYHTLSGRPLTSLNEPSASMSRGGRETNGQHPGQHDRTPSR